MSTSKIPRPPQQPIVSGAIGKHFLPNLLVVYIAQHGRVDIMKILSGDNGRFSDDYDNSDSKFSDDDARQLQQLLGIKVSAYESLPYVHPNVLEPYCEAEPSDLTPFEPSLARYDKPKDRPVDLGMGRDYVDVEECFEVRTGPKDTDVRTFGTDLQGALKCYGEAYARWKGLVEEERSDEPAGFRQPMQPMIVTEEGHDRFRMNKIVDYLLDHGGIDLNRLAREPFPREDRMQFAQLIGYSLSGYSELSYVTDESYDAAWKLAKRGER